MKYAVYNQWSYVEPIYERCFIRKAVKGDKAYDGANMISGANRDGYTFDIYNNLELAITNSGFNPKHITFADDIDKKSIKRVLNQYDWTYETGYKKKEIK